MYKLVIFDMDGVLVDSSKIHYESTISAIKNYSPDFDLDDKAAAIISDSIPTTKKLALLSDLGKLNASVINNILSYKQELTIEEMSKLTVPDDLVADIENLSQSGVKIAVASNANTSTVSFVLNKIGINKYCDLVLGNSDVTNPKPHPEIFVKCMTLLNSTPPETLIFEDSDTGITAAMLSGANVIKVDHPSSLINLLRKNILNVYR